MHYPTWRWEQGRLDYFDFNNIKLIANALINLEGIRLEPSSAPVIRDVMENTTSLPYLPTSYSVWRNYARVFRCELLAAEIDKKLIVSDICRALAGRSNDAWDVDDYFSFMIPRFYYPSPAFIDYDHNAQRIFPVCALLKYLLAKQKQTGDGAITVEEVFSILIGNSCTGFEPQEFYYRLSQTGHKPMGDQRRQVREMLIFYSQCSFLKWREGTLYLDVDIRDANTLNQIESLTSPIQNTRNIDKDAEVLSLASLASFSIVAVNAERTMPNDLSFTEGKKVRVTHLRIERSPRLRRLFFETLPRPILCDVCDKDMNRIYPWTVDLLEVHHLLPLSSSIAIQEGDTSFGDLVPLCPNCHKSVHVYYRNWLRESRLDDFPSKNHANQAYGEAKERAFFE